MKKYLKSFYAFAVMLLCSLIMFGCGVKIESHTVKSGTIETTIAKNTTLVTDNFEAIIKYSDDTTKTITSSDVTFGELDTTTTGNKDLKVTYGDYSFVIKINIVETSADIATVTMFNSQIVDDFTNNKGTQSNTQEEFVNKNDHYYVGDDNIFHFRINAKGIDGAGNLVENLQNVRTTVKMESVTYTNNVPSYTLLTDDQVNNYVTINTENTTFDFKESAIDQVFRITVSAVNYDDEYFDNAPSFNFTVKVVDGYNVYNATDLSVLDNTGEYGWNDKKSTELQSISNNINGVIIHSDINVTDDDLPAGLFYNQTEANAVGNGVTNQTIKGSLKDDSSYQLYGRYLNENQEFNFIGNYYQIDFSDVAKIVVESGSENGIIANENGNEEAITAHTSFMRFDPKEGNTTFPDVNIKNISFKGNGARSEKAIESGGMILMKSKGTNLVVDNTIYQDSFIGYMFERFDGFDDNELDSAGDNSSYQILNTKGYNCYNSLLYFWGAKNVLIENSELIGAGGPVMIVDHVGNDETTGAGGYPTIVNIIASKLESFVTGQEPWFVTYGATALASQLKAADAVYDAVHQINQAYNTNIVRPTFLVDKDNVQDMINIICIVKSSSAEGMTVSRVRGNVTIFESREDYEEQVNNGDKSFGLYFQDTISADNLTDKARGSLADAVNGDGSIDFTKTYNYFESNKTGGYIGTDIQSGATPVGEFYKGKYVNVYLFNGMGAIFGLYPSV